MSEVKKTIQHLVDKYRCDPNDPIFAILEKMDEYHKEVKDKVVTSLSLEKDPLKGFIETLQLRTEELKAASLKLSVAREEFEKNAQIVAESTDALTRYWKQIHLRHAFIGMLVSSILFGIAWGIFYYKSADRLLNRAGVILTSESGNKASRLVLSGKKLLYSGKTETQLAAEFSR